jgi:hypothetical protein
MHPNLLHISPSGALGTSRDQYGYDKHIACFSLLAAAEHKVRADWGGRKVPPVSSTRTDAADRKELGEYWGAVQTTVWEMAANGGHRQIRTDAVDGSAGVGAPANYTQLMYKVIEEVRPPRHWQKMGRVGNGIAPGAMEYQLAFKQSSGEAAIWSGGLGGDRRMGVGLATVTRPQYHLLADAEVGFLQQQNGSFIGWDVRGALSAQAVLSHDIVRNRLAFQGGGSDLDCWGLKNYPTLGIDYTGLSRASYTGAQLAQALSDMVWGPTIASNQAFEPTVLAVSMRIRQDMTTLQIAGAGGSGMTVEEWFGKNFPGVRLETWNELDELMGTSTYAMFSYPDDGNSAPQIEASPVIMLPEYQYGVGYRIFAYSRYGGMVLPYSIGARIGVVEA